MFGDRGLPKSPTHWTTFGEVSESLSLLRSVRTRKWASPEATFNYAPHPPKK